MDVRHTPKDDRRWPGERWPGDLCAAWALVTAAAVPLLALVLPIETVDTGRAGVQPRHSLYALHGAVVLLPACAPLAAAALVACALYAGRGGGRPWTLILAWALSVLVAGAALVGFLTFLIGVFVLPTGLLLIAATLQAQTSGRNAAARRAPSQRPPRLSQP